MGEEGKKVIWRQIERIFDVLFPGLLLAAFFSKTPHIALALLVGSMAVLGLLYDIKYYLRELKEQNDQTR